MKKVTTLALAALLLAPAGALAQTAAISLSLPPTARANAMGEAYVALADDGTAAWWNPAGLGFLTQKDASVTHAQLVPDLADDVFQEFLVFALPVESWGTFAGSLIYLTYGTSEARSETGEFLGEFSSYEFAPVLSYGTAIADQIGIGVNFKYVRVQLAPDLPNVPGSGKGSTVAADLGVLWKVPGNFLNLGGTLQNLGPDIEFVTEDRSDPIYRNLKLGFAVTPYQNETVAITAIGDLNQLMVKGEVPQSDGSVVTRYPKPIYNGGVEGLYRTKDFALALRGGYVHDDEGSISDPTYGGGFMYKGVRLDLASIPQAEDSETGEKLARVTKLSLGFSF
jgi:hypothetical protein